ncbi:15744_t:CDS:2 [Cetraspora pellucida]|uniref:15744_t:CDS:1 n=1 Tax=Cetraspora pellucida TaxID=1433469 RepID=A0A9N9IBI3_9GLOM|nr:15744_t:CDS:2 [Cetraspora pellucida]
MQMLVYNAITYKKTKTNQEKNIESNNIPLLLNVEASNNVSLLNISILSNLSLLDIETLYNSRLLNVKTLYNIPLLNVETSSNLPLLDIETSSNLPLLDVEILSNLLLFDVKTSSNLPLLDVETSCNISLLLDNKTLTNNTSLVQQPQTTTKAEYILEQSTNHNAIAEDALVATRMNLGSRGSQLKMHNKLKEELKGIKKVLEEYNLWLTEGVHLRYKQCSKKKDNSSERLNCCAPKIIELQPDFCEQKLLLEEALVNVEHIFEKYPKYYYECNFIERYWGFIKQKTRKSCIYNYNDLLKRIPNALTNVFLTKICRFAYKL